MLCVCQRTYRLTLHASSPTSYRRTPMPDYVDVPLNIARVQSHEVHTVINPGETLQLLRVTLPDGSQSPWLAFTPAQYSDLMADMRTRQLAALENEQTYREAKDQD